MSGTCCLTSRSTRWWNPLVDEDEAKAVAMKFVKELGEGLKLEDVVRS